jgi:hypothetical protein
MEKKSFIMILITIIFFGLAVHVLAAEEIITNETILTMVKAGLGEELIISKIKTSKNQFDVSMDGILKLKNEGVNENIIKAMLEASKPKVSTPPEPSGIAGMIISNLYLKKAEKLLAIPPIIAETAVSSKRHFIPYYFGPHDIWHFIRGEKSIVRTNEKNPLFCTKMNPSGFVLVKLTYQKAKDIRFVISTGSVYKETIPIEFKESQEGLFEIFSKVDLLPGEYAFLSRERFHDFGVDQ